MYRVIQQNEDTLAANALLAEQRQIAFNQRRQKMKEEAKKRQEELKKAAQEAADEEARLDEEQRLYWEQQEQIEETITTHSYEYEEYKNSLMQRLSEEDPIINTTSRNRYRQPTEIVITAPTQGGKSNEIIDIACRSPPYTLTVIVCDNKKDQIEQFMSRISEAYDGGVITVSSVGKLTRANIKKIIDCYLDSNKRIVIVLLNNSTQCKKLRELENNLLSNTSLEIVKYNLIF